MNVYPLKLLPEETHTLKSGNAVAQIVQVTNGRNQQQRVSNLSFEITEGEIEISADPEKQRLGPRAARGVLPSL